MRTLLTALLWFALASVAAAQSAYRWVDENGQVHFSDRPQPGAQEFKLQEPTGYSTPRRPPSELAGQESRSAPAPQAFRYESVAITAPQPDEVLWNIGGTMNVRLSLQPALQSGHRVQVYYDGALLEDLRAGPAGFTLTEVYRGTHTIAAAVVNQQGQELARSAPVTFHVRQRSRQRAP